MARMDGSTLHYIEYGVRITCVGSDDYLPTLLYIFVFPFFFWSGIRQACGVCQSWDIA